jgi:pimeloyl-ACP methyl ester carboxylesterase
MRKLLVVALGFLALAGAAQAGTGTTFPAGFVVPTDASLSVPVIGFGAAGPVTRTPVILLHGNNDTPYPTACNPFFGQISALGSYLLDHGYAPSEVWALGYQGDQCDLLADNTRRSGEAHTTLANVADLDAFVHAVLDYTGAKRVDIVGHSLGGTLARAWMKQTHSGHLVRRLVEIASPNHGIINCSPDPANYFQTVAGGGFTPTSAVCLEYGAADTPFLSWLNGGTETPGPTRYLSIYNGGADFVYISAPDGPFFPAVPAQDRTGAPHDFSQSPALYGPLAENVVLTGQGAHDLFGTGHLGILASPDTWKLTLDFLTAPNGDVGGPRR